MSLPGNLGNFQSTPVLLVLAGLSAWILGSCLAFYDHSDATAASFVGAGLVLFLVAAYFDQIEEAGPGGIKVRPKVNPVSPGAGDEALSPTPDERTVEPPAGTVPSQDISAEIEEGEVATYNDLAEIPAPTVAALFRKVNELSEPSGAHFVRARRKRGRGNNPWLFEFEFADGSKKAWRVSWGGRGKRLPTVGKGNE